MGYDGLAAGLRFGGGAPKGLIGKYIDAEIKVGSACAGCVGVPCGIWTGTYLQIVGFQTILA